jgi:uncharacterized protein (TIGR02145 family)
VFAICGNINIMSFIVLGLLLIAQVTATGAPEFRDPRDGAVYPVVRVGSLEWLGRNLSYAAPSTWCYQDDPTDCVPNGRLYPWSSASTACPSGWRLPSDEDWMNLEAALGMPAAALRAERARGTDQGLKLQPGGSSGLDIPISGYRRPEGDYARRGERAAFWASTEANPDDAWHRDIRPGAGTIYRSPVTKTYALSVRCVRSSQ